MTARKTTTRKTVAKRRKAAKPGVVTCDLGTARNLPD